MRAQLAGLIESLLLVDRLLYLEEHGLVASVEPLFDPSISPRNCCLVAVRVPPG